MNDVIESTIPDLPYTLIAEPNRLKGELHFSGHVHLQATIEGRIIMGPESRLLIDRMAIVDGHVEGNDIEILGTVHGDITSSGRVIIRSSAKIEGTLTTKSLVVYPGAELNLDVDAE